MSADIRKTLRGNTQNNGFLYPEESFIIRGSCFIIYKKFRNAQKESVYQKALTVDLQAHGLIAEREKRLSLYHLGIKVGTYTPDIIVNDAIIIELKAKSFLLKEDVQQFWQYLKNSEFKLGFLINFGEPHGVKIIRRVYDTVRQRNSA